MSGTLLESYKSQGEEHRVSLEPKPLSQQQISSTKSSILTTNQFSIFNMSGPKIAIVIYSLYGHVAASE
jgi:hypothetical protein